MDREASDKYVSARWLILADDLTGAADAAVAFARRGHGTEVSWGNASPPDDVAVQALDLDSRGAPATGGAAGHHQAVGRWLEARDSLFHKIDSTLRGQPAAEMAAICMALRECGRPAWGLLAPANPAMRRTTRDGRVFVAGQPLENTSTWKREHSYPDADLAAIVGTAGLRAVKLPLSTLRGDPAGLHAALVAVATSVQAAGTMLVCDAESDDDLARLVAATRDAAAPGFFTGTAGLAKALSEASPAAPRSAISLEATGRGTLVAVGTLAEVSREAARRVAAREGTSLLRISSESGNRGPGEAQIDTSIAARLSRGETAVAMLDAPEPARVAINAGHAEYFAATLSLALHQMGALIVTGGETAAALLAQCKVHGIRLLDELEPGIALGVTRGAVEVPVITKPGAFGDEESLMRCLDHLNALRRNA
jgi:uncharacterized protein YgbK (DUF1537 family)